MSLTVKLNEEQFDELMEQLESINQTTSLILASLNPLPATTVAISLKGNIDMAQTKYAAVLGPDTITLTTLDQNGNDITSKCTYTATSGGTIVTGITVTANTIAVTNVQGTSDTLTISTSDAGFTVPDLVLAVSLPVVLVPGTTTAVSKTGVIS